MQANELKEYLLNNELCEDVLTALGCGHIRNRGEYISASNPDGGDNKQAITLYLSENLNCIDYTRQISKTKRATDIFDLVAYFKQCTFAESMKWVCDTVGLDYYHEPDDVPESLLIIKMLKEMSIGCDEEDNTPLKPISEDVLRYYLPYGNKKWEDEGISLETQREFNIMYDPQTNYIAIPIFDSIGSLVGIKGRYFGISDEYHSRFTYLEKCNKSKVLYGYWQNKEFIKNNKYIIVVESEKSVLKLAEYGYRNVVSTGGKTISKYQIELITRTGCVPVFAFDEDVKEDELEDIANLFIDGVSIYAVIDRDGLLEEKESPMDRQDVWRELYKNNVYKIK